MPLYDTRDMLRDAQNGRYAVGAFNIENAEMAQAAIWAAEKLRSPVILQTTPGTLAHAAPAVFYGIVSALAQAAAVPVALHLDHGDSAELAGKCVQAGYTSLMIDGSRLPYDQNIALTRRVAALSQGLPVEAELGTIGGKEDASAAGGIQLTDPALAADFARRTGISSLAVAIGTSHGIYKGEPRLDMARLAAIRAAVDIPLVLHGASGVPHTQVRACIARGVCKVNYATELRAAFTEGVRALLARQPGAYDPKAYLSEGRNQATALVRDLIRLCGCDGKA